MMPLVRIPTSHEEPVSLEEMKEFLRVDYDIEDDTIRASMKAAREWIERRCEIAIARQDYEYRTASFPDEYPFPKPPTAGFDGVFYMDDEGDMQAVDLDAYIFIEGGDDEPAQIIRDKSVALPADVAKRPDAVRIRFATGYPASDKSPPQHGEYVPEDLRQAIKLITGHFYESRSEVALVPVRQEIVQLPMGALDLIAPYITPRL